MTFANEPVTAELRRVDSAKLVQSIVLLLAGMAFTFTQTLHQDFTFNRWLYTIFAVVYGVSLLVVTRRNAEASRTRIARQLAGVSLGAGIAAPWMADTRQLAFVIIIWAGASALLLLWSWLRTRHAEDRVLALLSGVLAIALIPVTDHLPTVMGFFAGFVTIAGVYLAIGSFDGAGVGERRSTRDAGEDAA